MREQNALYFSSMIFLVKFSQWKRGQAHRNCFLWKDTTEITPDLFILEMQDFKETTNILFKRAVIPLTSHFYKISFKKIQAWKELL